MGILLQAADRAWATDPGLARAHVRRAAAAAAENLDEARRFVRDLRPPGLDNGGTLPEALTRLCADTGGGPPVRLRLEGEQYPWSPACRRRCCAWPRARWPTSATTRAPPVPR
ncbi:histidine kinase [Nonomuraea rubra]|uniref:histidine kinase n=1 Tax=Nonomuraea rubra TaxID=46180 RepID=UPI00361B073C